MSRFTTGSGAWRPQLTEGGKNAMATDIFLKIDDIKGESQDKTHKDEIEVQSWQWGLSQSGSAHTGTGGGSAKVSVQDISITKAVDRATPTLMKFCCSGKHFDKAQLTVRKAGGNKPVEYVKIKLSTVFIAGVSCHGTQGDERLSETVTLHFAKFEYEYTPQAADGSAGATIPVTWDIKANSP
jgi:type VI secretion system secreted protein Hcp